MKRDKLNFVKLVSIILFWSFIDVFSQPITYTDITSQYTLPGAVKVFKGERTSPALKLWYFDVDLNDPNIGIRPYMLNNNKLGVPTFVQQMGAYAGINAGYFDVNSNSVLSSCVYPGEVLARTPQYLTRNSVLYPVTRGFFGIKNNKNLKVDWIYHFSSTINDLYKYNTPTQNSPGSPAPAVITTNGTKYDSLHFGFAGGPVLIKNGTGNITYNEEVFWSSGVELNVAQPRTAIGYTQNNHAILLVADGRQTASNGLTLVELKDIMLELGCYEALNLDGGGSSQIAVGNNLINRPEGGTYTRPVPVIVAIVKSDSLYFPKKILFEKVIDTSDPECQINGSWTPSSNSGYYGNTPSLLATIGSGDKYINYNFNPPKAAQYSVQAWWVSSFNRSMYTPYIINSKNKIDTVKANQTINGSKWVDLGSFYFDDTKPYTITISNNTNNGSYVCADAIRLISYDTVFNPTSVEKHDISMNESFILYPNYPNPIGGSINAGNFTTTIEFEILDKKTPIISSETITNEKFISLKIYDILGRVIETLVDQKQLPGKYQVRWDGGKYPSGVYFYELKTYNFRTMKTMLLIK